MPSEPRSNPEDIVRLAAGLTFVGLAAVTPISVMSASNSSRFSYRSFIRDDEGEKAAREALRTFLWQSLLTSGVLGAMAWAATRDTKWVLYTFGAGAVSTVLLWWDMSGVVDEVVAKNNGGTTNALLEG